MRSPNLDSYYAGDEVMVVSDGNRAIVRAADYRTLTNEKAVPHSHAKHSSFQGLNGPDGVERVEAVVTSHKVQLYPGSYEWDKHVYQPWDEEADVVGKDIEVQLQEAPEDFYIKAKTTFKVRP